MDECIYCGEPATDRDHVIPCAYRAAPRHYSTHTVPSCRECNQKILHDLPYFTVFQRTEYVAGVLRKRLLKCLDAYTVKEYELGLYEETANLALRAEFAMNQAKDMLADEY